ncbi:MAG TPA: RNA-binding cell elongation regulator Jag/EloR [Atribacteraceae bacterium]|nr:RNA-binding cell elongation regulator Jag/EloR [Atribacteraceae bacterium]
MRRNVEISGKNLAEVLERASCYFEVDRKSLGFEVLSENRGFLGIFSPRMVRVRVWVDNGERIDPLLPKVVRSEKPAIEEKLRETGLQKEKEEETVPVSQGELEEAREEIRLVFGQLIGRMEMDIEYHVRENGRKILLDIDGKDASLLIGKYGETLEAVESFLKIILVKKGLHRIGLDVDVSGYRKRRRETLIKLANKLASKVLQEKKKIKLEPMVARDRRIIHKALEDHPQIMTYSLGTEPDRRIVIDLRNARNKDGNRKKPQRHRRRPKPE